MVIIKLSTCREEVVSKFYESMRPCDILLNLEVRACYSKWLRTDETVFLDICDYMYLLKILTFYHHLLA